MFLQNADDLFIGKSGLLHCLSSSQGIRLTSKRGQFRGAGQRLIPRRYNRVVEAVEPDLALLVVLRKSG